MVEKESARTIGFRQHNQAHREDEDGTNIHLSMLGSGGHHVKLYPLSEVQLLRCLGVGLEMAKSLGICQVLMESHSRSFMHNIWCSLIVILSLDCVAGQTSELEHCMHCIRDSSNLWHMTVQ